MKKRIGTITLSELTYLSDPCYGCETMGNDVINTIPGDYYVYITRSKNKSKWLENRISSIIAIHKDYAKTHKHYPNDDYEYLGCAVDSGTCGIFNAEYFEKYHTADDVNDEWYDEHVIQMDEFKITDGLGAICSSGCGDGWYPVFAEYKGDNAFAIRIKFL